MGPGGVRRARTGGGAVCQEASLIRECLQKGGFRDCATEYEGGAHIRGRQRVIHCWREPDQHRNRGLSTVSTGGVGGGRSAEKRAWRWREGGGAVERRCGARGRG